VDDERWALFAAKREATGRETERLTALVVRPGDPGEDAVQQLLGAPLTREQRAFDLLRRPGVDYHALTALPGIGPPPPCADERIAAQVALQVDVQAKYSGYIERQQADILRQRRSEQQRLPDDLDYGQVAGLSHEARQRLAAARPATLGQASRLPGITPAAVSILLIHLRKRAAAA